MTVSTRDLLVDGLRLHVAEAGDGPALLLVHGLTASHAVWEHTVEAFADRWRVIALDLPGHGASAKPDAPYTIDFHAGMVRSLARALGVDEAVVVGSSLDEAFQQSFHDRRRIGHVVRRRILEERLLADDFPEFARAVARSLGGVLAADPQPLERVTQPVLVVWGRQDRFVPLARSAGLLRKIPHARLHALDRCGHLPMLEQPAAFNQVVADFLRAAWAAPRPLAEVV